MILETFSITLKAEFSPSQRASVVLRKWLIAHLSNPNPASNDKVHCVINAELELLPPLLYEAGDAAASDGYFQLIQPKTATGVNLLNALLHYCDSYEHWHYRRWLHRLQASDFKAG